MYQQQVDEIRRLTKLDGKTKEQRIIKLMEEVGELAEAVLSETGAPGCEYKNKDSGDVVEEAVDVIIVALSILDAYEIPDPNIFERLRHKLHKWKLIIRDTR